MVVLLLAIPAASLADIQYGIESTVNIHTESQDQYLQGKYSAIGKFADGTQEFSRPQEITIDWSGWENAGNTDILMLGTQEDFSDAILIPAEGTSAAVGNLRLGTTYYWKIVNAVGESETSQFHTASGIVRNIYVDGVTNVRDLGGYPTTDGREVRQGMIYRSARLNQDDTATVTPEITEKGIRTMTEELGILSEIDLRRPEDGENGGLTESVLGSSVRYFNIPMTYSTADNKFDPINSNAESIRALFSILANESNYPLFFHCSIGTDRTGMVAYLLNGLCGVEKDNLFYDYLFSNFGNIGWARQASSLSRAVYVTHINKCTGDTLSEKIYNCLLDIGVTAEELDAVRQILCE